MQKNGFSMGFFDESLLHKILQRTNLSNKFQNGGINCSVCDCKVTLENLGSIAKIDKNFQPICDRIDCISNIQMRFLNGSK